MTRASDISWRGESISRLVLGTAQLGMTYGIANVVGQPSPEQARRMVSEALRGGVRFFDTAQAYGESEATLGAALGDLDRRAEARIITKLSPDLDPQHESGLREAVVASCRRLGTDRLWGLMLHREKWLRFWPLGLGDALRPLRDEGLVRYLGASVYTVAGAREALENPDIDIVQVPCNAWHRRMPASGIFDLAAGRDKLCFVRSIYLQGLLTLSPEQVAKRLPAAAGTAARWHALAQSLGTSVRDLAVRYALSLKAPIVVGAETAEQVRQNVALLESTELDEETAGRIETALGHVPEEITNPSCWAV